VLLLCLQVGIVAREEGAKRNVNKGSLLLSRLLPHIRMAVRSNLTLTRCFVLSGFHENRQARS
jgi:hypothetical protein